MSFGLFFRIVELFRQNPDISQIMFCDLILNQSKDHSYAGKSKSIMPVNAFSQPTGCNRCNKGSDIDPHIKDRKTCVASGRFIVGIQTSDNRADIWLKKSGSNDDKNKTEIEGLVCWDGHGKVSGRDNDTTVPDGISQSHEFISQPATRQSKQIHKHGI